MRLCLNRPEHAAVLCADEKSQIQALDRMQPQPPPRKALCETVTHDYQRNGTTALFAAMRILDGTAIGLGEDRNRNQEWLKFQQQQNEQENNDLNDSVGHPRYYARHRHA